MTALTIFLKKPIQRASGGWVYSLDLPPLPAGRRAPAGYLLDATAANAVDRQERAIPVETLAGFDIPAGMRAAGLDPWTDGPSAERKNS